MGTPSAAGRHRIDRLLGSGGFASVWLGHDAELDSPVVVKILADHWTLREDVRERFRADPARARHRAPRPEAVQRADPLHAGRRRIPIRLPGPAPSLVRCLCYWGKDLATVPGDPALNLAAAYRSSARTVREAGGVPPEHRAYAGKVRRYIRAFQPG